MRPPAVHPREEPAAPPVAAPPFEVRVLVANTLALLAHIQPAIDFFVSLWAALSWGAWSHSLKWLAVMLLLLRYAEWALVALHLWLIALSASNFIRRPLAVAVGRAAAGSDDDHSAHAAGSDDVTSSEGGGGGVDDPPSSREFHLTRLVDMLVLHLGWGGREEGPQSAQTVLGEMGDGLGRLGRCLDWTREAEASRALRVLLASCAAHVLLPNRWIWMALVTHYICQGRPGFRKCEHCCLVLPRSLHLWWKTRCLRRLDQAELLARWRRKRKQA